MSTKHVRKKKLVNTSLQLKMVGVFLAVACVASLFQVIVLNFSMMRVVRSTMGDSDPVLARIPSVLAQNQLFTLGILVPLMTLFGVVVTHRVAGPAFAMEKYLRRIADGERPKGPCRIRRGDEMGGLCDAINGAIASLSKDAAPVAQSYTEVSVDEVKSLIDDAQPASQPESEAAPTGEEG